MATLIRAGRADVETIYPRDGVTFDLAELQTIVGGYIEAIRAPDGRLLFCNEDGKRLNLPPNWLATALMAGRLQPDDVLVGDVVLCDRVEATESEVVHIAETLDRAELTQTDQSTAEVLDFYRELDTAELDELRAAFTADRDQIHASPRTVAFCESRIAAIDMVLATRRR